MSIISPVAQGAWKVQRNGTPDGSSPLPVPDIHPTDDPSELCRDEDSREKGKEKREKGNNFAEKRETVVPWILKRVWTNGTDVGEWG